MSEPPVDQRQTVEKAIFRLRDEQPELSGHRVLSGRQKVFLVAALGVSAAWAILNWMQFLIVVNALAVLYYLALSVYKFYLIDLSLVSRKEIHVGAEELRSLSEADLPVYTILVPLYRESEVLPELLRSLAQLDYPREKLDIILLLEKDDTETRQAVARLRLPGFIRPEVVPDVGPRTKPKACNWGLHLARGKYLVIYDAEDRPERDQLKKAVTAFAQVSQRVVCLQAKLNFYNPRQNLLSRLFTIEYSMWFDLFLPGLDYLAQPVPLGGTSNHFIAEKLRELRGWDPYNVTEDCDLGVRIAACGYQTRMIDSTTWEEACAHPFWWIRQRSRWIKGYLQTYLVHMRHPVRLWRRLGTSGTLGFHLMIGGTPICLLINPIYWALAGVWVVLRSEEVAGLFPYPTILAAMFSLFAGNFVFVYAGLLAAYRRRYYDLVKYALLMPVYWVMMSVGAWRGCLQLVRRASFWEKTQHGLAPRGEVKTAPATARKQAG